MYYKHLSSLSDVDLIRHLSNENTLRKYNTFNKFPEAQK